MACTTFSGIRSSMARAAAPTYGAALLFTRRYRCTGVIHLGGFCILPALRKEPRRRNPQLSSFIAKLHSAPVPSTVAELSTGFEQRKVISSEVDVKKEDAVEAQETQEGVVEGFNGESLPRKFRVDAKTGAFQQLPMVSPAHEILGSALRKAKMVRPTKGIVNAAKRERNRGAKQLDALMKELALPLKTYVQKFPRRLDLHAYENELVNLTLGSGQYEDALVRVDDLRKKVLEIGKNYASLCAKSTKKVEAEQHLTEGFTKLEEVFNRYGKAVDDLKEHAKTLRAMPVISLRTPTLCLVGAPNVGKSSLVRVLSSGKPEICNYQFTTRGISIGHFEVNSRRFQVTDTPGLLERPDDDRNNMEKLTLAALSHLPTSILYVHDLTEQCGSSALKQFAIYSEIKKRFSDRPWLDVVSKADLVPPISSSSAHEEGDNVKSYPQFGPSGALWVSVETGQGVEELVKRVHALLVQAHPDESKDEGSTWETLEQNAQIPKAAAHEFYYPAWPRKQEN